MTELTRFEAVDVNGSCVTGDGHTGMFINVVFCHHAEDKCNAEFEEWLSQVHDEYCGKITAAIEAKVAELGGTVTEVTQ